MSTNTVKGVAGEPIVIATINSKFTPEDIAETMSALFALIESRPFYFIIDTTPIIMDFRTMLIGFGGDVSASRQQSVDFTDITTVFAGLGDLGETLEQVYVHEEFGNRRILLFDTLDEALSAIRAEIANN